MTVLLFDRDSSNEQLHQQFATHICWTIQSVDNESRENLIQSGAMQVTKSESIVNSTVTVTLVIVVSRFSSSWL